MSPSPSSQNDVRIAENLRRTVELTELGLALRQAVIDASASKPFLGICIGLQLLFEHSEEGDADGLGILPGRVVRFVRPKELR